MPDTRAEIPLGDCALVPGPLRALQLALRGAGLHVGEVGCLLRGQLLAPDLDALPAKRRVEAFERRTLALVFVFESRAREGREQLAFLDAVARAHLIADVAGCDGEECGAHCRDHRALRRDVAHEGSLGHRRDAQPLARDHVLARTPAADQQAEHHDEHERGRRCAGPHDAAAIRLGLERDVLALGALDQKVVAGRAVTAAGRDQGLEVGHLHSCPSYCNRRARCAGGR